MDRLRFAVLGQGLVFSATLERLDQCGHRIVAAVNTSRTERSRLPEALSLHDFDVLLSVANPWILDDWSRSRAQLAAVNYHNSLLPTYAGLRAANWAIFNGEVEHGITWHLMDTGIDTGRLLVQRRFALELDETAASLSLRCTSAALEGLDELLAKLGRGDLSGIIQEPRRRSYYGRRDTVPGGGLIDWSKPADDILRLVRACTGGDRGFGKALVQVAPGRHRVVASAERAHVGAEPGAVLHHDQTTLMAGCADGAVRVQFADTAELANVPSSDLVVATRPEPSPCSTATVASAETIPAMIVEAAARSPAAWAVACGSAVLSYADLATRSASVARRLAAEGVKHEAGVGILLPTGPDFVVAALGAMRAGAAYVPLNPESPATRHGVEISEAGITHVILDGTSSALPCSGDLVVIDIATLDDQSCEAELPHVSGDSCAYRIFTSGSTGTPKAVEVTHDALANLVGHCITALPLGPNDRMTMLAAPTFDAAVADTWPVLVAGGTLLSPPPRILLDPKGLVDWLAEARATCAFVPTVVAERLIRMHWPRATSLRTLLTGGDTLHVRPKHDLPFRVINSYGPTENCVASLWSTVTPGAGQPTIGRVIQGVSMEIVHPDGRPANPGETGEIVLGGAQVARGYRCRPGQTARQFREDPTNPGKRRYHTGDLGRVNDEGEVEYCGRIDRQVQILGVRIEPEEVEAVLRAHDQVVDAVCLPERRKNSVTGLIAHVTTADMAQASAVREALAAHLAAHLPSLARPKMVVVHESLPLTTAGKIDRRALAAEVAITAPTPANDTLEKLWAQAVPRSCSAPELDFWEAGGDSLAAIDLLLAISDTTSVHVAVGTFLADPSLAGLRRAIGAGHSPSIVRLREGAGPPLVCWYGHTGDLGVYQQLIASIEGREVLGVLSPGLADADRTPRSIEEAAALGLEALRCYGVAPPFNMIGYSWGGLVAFEAARQLTQSGTPPAFVGLMGSIPPQAVATRAQRTAQLARRIPKVAVRLLSGQQGIAFTSRRMLRSLQRIMPTPLRSSTELPKIAGLSRSNLDLARTYRPDAGGVRNVWLFRESGGRHFVGLSGRVRHELDDLGWSAWTGAPVTVEWVDADHLNLMRAPAIHHIARSLSLAMPKMKAKVQSAAEKFDLTSAEAA